MADLVLTDDKIKEIMLESDITNKSQIAALLKEKYSIENWVYPNADVLRDLVFCWLVKSYFIGAHEAIDSYVADGDPNKVTKLNALKKLYEDAHGTQVRIDASLDMTGFSQSIGALGMYNPLLP